MGLFQAQVWRRTWWLKAGKVLEDLSAQRLKIEARNFIAVLQAEAQLRHYLPLVNQVLAQTQARISSTGFQPSLALRPGKPISNAEFNPELLTAKYSKHAKSDFPFAFLAWFAV
jgi:hypothetical protein